MELGLYCRVHDQEGGTIGCCHLPAPVDIDDLVALEHGEYRIVNVVVSPAVRLSVVSH